MNVHIRSRFNFVIENSVERETSILAGKISGIVKSTKSIFLIFCSSLADIWRTMWLFRASHHCNPISWVLCVKHPKVYAEYSTAALLSSRGRCVLCMRLLCIRHDWNRVRGDVRRRRPTPQGTSGMRSKTLTEIVLGVGIAHWDSVASDAWKGMPEKDRKGRKQQRCERKEKMSLSDTRKTMIYKYVTYEVSVGNVDTR